MDTPTRIDETAWRNELKIGDLVIVNGTSMSTHGDYIAKVSHATPTTIDVGEHPPVRYRRKDGYAQNGDSWHRSSISYPDPSRLQALRAAAERARLTHAIETNLSQNDLSLEALRLISAICVGELQHKPLPALAPAAPQQG